MATVQVYDTAGKPAGELELNDDIFGLALNSALVHQSVVATLANQRQGTASTKTRGDVHHSTRKLYRQKGTGRARQGMRSAPHMKGGGIVFGPHPRSYHKDLPKKMRRGALLSALSSRVADGGIIVIEQFAFTQPKTKDAVNLLTALGVKEKKVLVVLDEIQESVVLSFRNLPKVLLMTAEMLGTYDVLAADVLLFSRSSMQLLEELKQQPLGSDLWMEKQVGGAENE